MLTHEKVATEDPGFTYVGEAAHIAT